MMRFAKLCKEDIFALPAHLSRKRPSARTKGHLCSWGWKLWNLPRKGGRKALAEESTHEGICPCRCSLNCISIPRKTLSQPKPPQQDPTAIQTSNKGFFPIQAVKVNGTLDTGSIILFWKQPGSPSCQCILFPQKTTS